jgi:hypothetical protein
MRALILILAALPAWGAAYTCTSAASGNWKAISWTNCNSGYPDNNRGGGDTYAAILADGHAVTLSSSDSIDIGASGDSTSIALTLQGTSTLTGVGATLRLRGNAVYTRLNAAPDTAVSFTAASSWIWDATAASAPTTTHYRWGPSGGHFGFRYISFDSSSMSSNITGGAGVGFADCNDYGAPADFFYCGSLIASNSTFSYIGDADVSMWNPHPSGANPSVRWDVVNSRFDHCGKIYTTSGLTFSTDSYFRHSGNVHTDTTGSIVMQVGFANAIGTGTRLITGNHFDKAVGSGQMFLPTVTISDNHFGGTLVGVVSSGATALFARNIFRSPTAAGNQYVTVPSEAFTDTLFVWDSETNNPHFLKLDDAGTFDIGVTGNIFEYTGNGVTDDGGDLILIANIPAADVRTVTATGNLAIPSPFEFSPGTFVTFFGDNSANWRLASDNNTVFTGCASASCTTGGGWWSLMEGGGAPADVGAGKVTSAKNNIGWDYSERLPMFWEHTHSTATDIFAPASADYNLMWNVVQTANIPTTRTNSGYGYNAAMSVAAGGAGGAGEHDTHIDPRFADTTRSYETFDSAYLGHTASAWVTSTAYVVGDTVSITDAAYREGKTVNFRCIAGHTSGASTEPGSGADWRTNWEFATVGSMATAMATGATVTDGAIDCVACSYPAAMIKWIKRGFVPQNPAAWKAGESGVTPGAVSMSARGPAMVGAIGQ